MNWWTRWPRGIPSWWWGPPVRGSPRWFTRRHSNLMERQPGSGWFVRCGRAQPPWLLSAQCRRRPGTQDPCGGGSRGKRGRAARVPPGTAPAVVVDQLEGISASRTRPFGTPFWERWRPCGRCETRRRWLVISADFFDVLLGSGRRTGSSIRSMSPDCGGEPAEALANPAEPGGYYVEDRLLDALIRDAGEEPGVLPVLQEPTLCCGARARRRLLTLAAYQDLSRDGPGISRDSICRSPRGISLLSAQQLRIAERVFLRLVQFGEGPPTRAGSSLWKPSFGERRSR